MNVTITPGTLSGTVTPPPSKSQAHRVLIAAALGCGESVISNVAFSQDIEATIRCLEELGAEFLREGSTVTVRGMGANAMSPLRRMAYPRLDCGESGSTLRFLIPVALAVRGGGIFTGRGRLMERPLKPYFDIFDEKGIFYEQKDGVLTVTGTLTPGRYFLPGNVSSQFVTGLLYALPLLEGDSGIILTSPLESRGYVNMTERAMNQFGVYPGDLDEVWRHTDVGELDEEKVKDGYFVPGGGAYRPCSLTVEGDWSQAAFWYAARFLGSPVEALGLDRLSQPDAAIEPYALRMSRSADFEQSVAHCPDLVPALALMGALRAGKATRLTNAARLRIKESDRLSSVAQVLSALGADISEGPDFLTIHGRETLEGGVTVDSFNDHRIAMMAAIAATRCEKPATILGAESVAKSYPNFWEEYERLGGKIQKAN